MLLKGIDESVVNMHVGDKYHLVFGGDLAFGQKGRSSGDDDELMVMMNGRWMIVLVITCIIKTFTYGVKRTIVSYVTS